MALETSTSISRCKNPWAEKIAQHTVALKKKKKVTKNTFKVVLNVKNNTASSHQVTLIQYNQSSSMG